MSASPSGLPNRQNPRPNPGGLQDPNGRPRPPPMKRRPRADPLVARKKPHPKNAPPRPGASSAAGPSRSQTSASVNPEAQSTALLSRIAEHRTKAAANGGWTEPKPPNAREWKIVTTKRAMLDGLRHHVMKFHSTNPKATIDPTNQNEFTRPVTLQRRDPRQPAAGREVKQPEAPPPEPNPVDEKEAERLAKLKADKEAWKAMEAAKSAPSLKDPNAPQRIKQPKQEERGVSFYRTPRSEQEKKQMDLRYEEALPWHIEDVDGKNVWVGSYVAPMSETHVCLVATHDGKFAMVPLEKWYKFVAKPNFDHMKIEEAEAIAKQNNGVSRWVMQNREKQAKQKEMDDTRQYFHGPARIKMESSTFRNASMEERFDHDQIDFEGDEFQDDDEAPNFEPDGDEDQKNADERIRREQLGANLFGDADEGKVDKEELEQRLLDEVRRKEGKKMTKALIKREKETIYQDDDSDSGYDPFESSSSEEDSDEEKDKEKQGEEEKDDKDDDKDKPSSSQDPSSQKQDGKDKNASSKGTLTPSGKQKQVDAAKKGKSLKRPGSPNLSESSGTESSRKKKQKKTGGNSVQPSRSGTPLPPGVAGQKHKLGMGSGSDGEATGGEMSDGAKRKKKLKILGTGPRATPTGSRAGSPVPASAAAASPASPGTRAGSPGQSDPIQVTEIRDLLPAQGGPGIKLADLLKAFSGRVGDGPGQTPKLDFIQLVKANAIYGQDKLMRRKD